MKIFSRAEEATTADFWGQVKNDIANFQNGKITDVSAKSGRIRAGSLVYANGELYRVEADILAEVLYVDYQQTSCTFEDLFFYIPNGKIEFESTSPQLTDQQLKQKLKDSLKNK